MVFSIWSYKCHEIYAFRLTAPWLSAKIMLPKLILAISGTRQPKCLKWVSWGSFWFILAISGTKQRTCSKRASWDSFWPYLVPGCQNAQNKTPGAHSGYISHQVTKMLKMSFLGLILAISAPGSRIYVFRLAAPWFSAFEAINARGFMHLDWQLHGFRHLKL